MKRVHTMVRFDSGPRRHYRQNNVSLHRYVPVPHLYLASQLKRNITERADNICISGCSSVWLERLIWDQEAAGSSPVTPMDRKGD